METRKYQPYPLHIGWALSKSYGDLFYTPKSLPGCFCSVMLLTAKNKAVS